MVEILSQITLFFENIILTFGYPGIYWVMVLENVLTPVPTEPLMPLAGMLSAQGQMNFFVVWASAVAGSTTGSLILYLIGRRGGEPLVRMLVRRYGRFAGLSESMLDRGLSLFARYGSWVIIGGRFLPVVRPTVSLIAGMSQLKLTIFIPCAMFSAIIVTFIYIYAGYLLGENWQQLLQLIGQHESAILVVIGVAGLAVLSLGGWWLLRARSRVEEAIQPSE